MEEDPDKQCYEEDRELKLQKRKEIPKKKQQKVAMEASTSNREPIIITEDQYANVEKRLTKMEERFTKIEQRFLNWEARIASVTERLTETVERLTKVEAEFQMERQGTKVESLQPKRNVNLIELEKQLAYQNTFSSVHYPPAQIPAANASSFSAISCTSSFSSAQNVLSASTAAGKPPSPNIPACLNTSRGPRVPFFETARKGDLAALRFFVNAGEKVNSRDKFGNTALHHAAINGHKDVAEFLIANKATVDLGDKHMRTPLHCAAANGHIAIAALLVANDAPVNARDEQGCTSVSFAAYEGHEPVIQFLLEHGASLHIPDNNGTTPLLMAVKNRRSGAARLLLRNEASPTMKNHEGESPLSFASVSCQVGILKDLLEKVSEFERGEIARSMSLVGRAEVVKIFAEADRDIVLGKIGEGACQILAFEGRHDVLLELLQLGVNVNAIDKFGITALHWAASKGHYFCVRALLNAGARVNVMDSFGNTPLMVTSDPKCIVALKKEGAV